CSQSKRNIHRLGSLRADDFRGARKNWSSFFPLQPPRENHSAGFSDSWNCTIVRPIENHLLFPQRRRIAIHSSLVTTLHSPSLLKLFDAIIRFFCTTILR